MSKGDWQRTLNTTKFNDNYDRIFGAKDGNKRVPASKEEEYTDKQTPTGKEAKAL